MRVLVNALAISNFSGRHVLLGFLRHLGRPTTDPFEFVVLHRREQGFLPAAVGTHVEWWECPATTSRWPSRTIWERLFLARTVRRSRADVVLSMSGASVGPLPVPEVIYAMNPWALVEGMPRTLAERIKAGLQRFGYRRAARASGAVFLSEFLREAYRRNAGVEPATTSVAYAGLDPDIRAAAARYRDHLRVPGQVLSVSVMAPHKDLETLVWAVSRLRGRGAEAHLVIAGPWADEAYRRRITALIEELGIGEAVTIRGEVSVDELYTLYAESAVFALLSRCESFGLPSIEAQTFGTPVVAARCCAIPEVCGQGGIFPPVGDVEAAAAAIGRLLSDPGHWDSISAAARRNSQKFQWEESAERLASVLLRVGDVAEAGRGELEAAGR